MGVGSGAAAGGEDLSQAGAVVFVENDGGTFVIPGVDSDFHSSVTIDVGNIEHPVSLDDGKEVGVVAF